MADALTGTLSSVDAEVDEAFAGELGASNRPWTRCARNCPPSYRPKMQS